MTSVMLGVNEPFYLDSFTIYNIQCHSITSFLDTQYLYTKASSLTHSRVTLSFRPC